MYDGFPLLEKRSGECGGERGLTFEEDELALAVLVHGVYLGRQAPPENTDEHGVSRHHGVVPHPPKPVVLRGKERGCQATGKHEFWGGWRRKAAITETSFSFVLKDRVNLLL